MVTLTAGCAMLFLEYNNSGCLCRCAIGLKSGSMLVLDNYQMLHGRLPYEGNKRHMLAILTSD